MLVKLLKYDIKSMGKSLIPLYLITILFGILTRGSNILSDKCDWYVIIPNMVIFFFAVTLIGSLFYTFIMSIKRYYTNLYKDEGYLTNTLPVKKWSILLSKLISSVIYIIINVLMIVIALLIAFYQKGIIQDTWNIVDAVFKTSGLDTTGIMIYVVAMMLISYINYIMTFYVALALGQKHNGNKLAYAIGYGVISYVVLEVLMVVVIGVLALITPDLFEQLNQEIPPIEIIKKVFAISTIVPIITSVVYYFITANVLNKRLNLE